MRIPPQGVWSDHGFRNDPMRALLRRLNVRAEDIDICPVERGDDGRMVYRRLHVVGQMRRWAAISLGVALQRRDKLLGFVFPDYSFRDDKDIITRPGGEVEVPLFVLLWKPEVNATRLAEGLERLRQRPLIVKR